MQIREGIILRNLMGQAILIDNTNRISEVMKLNYTAERIFKSLEENKSKEDAVKDLCDEFEIDEVTAGSDFDNFVELLKNQGILND